ncbi:unnamed protein product [Phytomonas sp. EM1]|nr:unnamed protein product [Phytomonas sp. EM1]|eukprot:CCW64204.1 unnamed protein product [Phytomonas sp. isolate EM1]
MVSQRVVRYVGYAGAAANWLVPIAGIVNFSSRPINDIDVKMTSVLCVYSLLFLRWSIAVSPVNYPLFFCHATNSTVQAATLLRLGYAKITQKPNKQLIK